jgi:hypothetical protein
MKITTSDLEFKYKQIYNELEANGGELTSELEEALAINENDFEERVDNYFGIVSQNEADIEKLKIVKSNIDAKIKAKTNINAYIENILKEALINSTPAVLTKAGYNSYKREFPNLQINLVASPSASVDVTDLQKIADLNLGNYNISLRTNDANDIKEIKKLLPNTEINAEFVPDKKSIGDKLKSGEIIEGAELFIKHNFKFK